MGIDNMRIAQNHFLLHKLKSINQTDISASLIEANSSAPVADSTISFLDDFANSISELYVYNHRNEVEDEHFFSKILLICIITVFIVSLFKTIIVLVCFFTKWLIFDFFCILGRLVKNKCLTFCKEMNYNRNYLNRAFKKIYTYNFYSYDRDIYGGFWCVFIPIVYILFIIGNTIFCLLRIEENLTMSKLAFTKLMLIIIFFLHLFVEIYNALFYIIKDLKRHIKFTIGWFLLASLHIVWLFFVYLHFKEESQEKFEFFERLARFTYIIFFLYCYSKSISIVYHYDMNSKTFAQFKVFFSLIFNCLLYSLTIKKRSQ